VAALIWSEHPEWTREQVAAQVQRMLADERSASLVSNL